MLFYPAVEIADFLKKDDQGMEFLVATRHVRHRGATLNS